MRTIKQPKNWLGLPPLLRGALFVSALVVLPSAAVSAADACQLAGDTAHRLETDSSSSDEQKLDQLSEFELSSACVAPLYRLSLAKLMYGHERYTVYAGEHFHKAVQDANKEESVLRAHSLAWYARYTWELLDDTWSEEDKEKQRAMAYKEARNAKEIYNRVYPGQELAWFDQYLLDMGEALKNPTVLAIAAQLDLQTVSRDAIAVAAAKTVELRINFEKGSDKLTRVGVNTITRLLDAVCQTAKSRCGSGSDMRLSLIGHTSTEGSEQYNLDLSKRRAIAVKRAILKLKPHLENGVSTTGLGESQPVYPRESQELMRKTNRRVEIKLGEG